MTRSLLVLALCRIMSVRWGVRLGVIWGEMCRSRGDFHVALALTLLGWVLFGARCVGEEVTSM